VNKFESTLCSFLERSTDTLAYPRDVEALALSLGLSITRVSSKRNPHPHLVADGTKTTIVIPQSHPTAGNLSLRDRFSVAHELGHYLVWRAHGRLPGSGKEYWEHEVICDRFAGRLLVPKSAVQQAYTKVGRDRRKWLNLPIQIGREALVSPQVAASRTSEETGRVFYFSAVRTKNARGCLVWRVTSSTLNTGNRQRVGAYAHLTIDSPEGQWLEELPRTQVACDIMDLRLPAATIKGAAIVACRDGNAVRFCTVSGFVQEAVRESA